MADIVSDNEDDDRVAYGYGEKVEDDDDKQCAYDGVGQGDEDDDICSNTSEEGNVNNANDIKMAGEIVVVVQYLDASNPGSETENITDVDIE